MKAGGDKQGKTAPSRIAGGGGGASALLQFLFIHPLVCWREGAFLLQRLIRPGLNPAT